MNAILIDQATKLLPKRSIRKAEKYIREGLEGSKCYRTWIDSFSSGTELDSRMIGTFICIEESGHHIFKTGLLDLSSIEMSLGEIFRMMFGLTDDDMDSLNDLPSKFIYVDFACKEIREGRSSIRQKFSPDSLFKWLETTINSVLIEFCYLQQSVGKFVKELPIPDQVKYRRQTDYVFSQYFPGLIDFGQNVIELIKARDLDGLDSLLSQGPSVPIWIPSFK